MSELDYDDEKDLDTSLSGDSAMDFFKSPSGMIQIPSVDKNNASISNSPAFTFDNDLAALLAAQEGQEGLIPLLVNLYSHVTSLWWPYCLGDDGASCVALLGRVLKNLPVFAIVL